MSDKKFEHLSFIHIFTSKENGGLDLFVEIPMLQRDYAYGRESEEEKRKTFLKSIKGYLSSTETNHELDFVYGSRNIRKNRECLTILDGQQRITTLFLLHWYLARICNKYDEFKNLMLDGDVSKFTYATRDSSTDFCNKLVMNGNFGKLNTEATTEGCILSDLIRDEKWFFNHWNNDPTVHNMLNMLDAIEELFPNKECRNYYEKLNKHSEKSSITFNFLPFDDFGLTDELYIKMNSRGKPLTRFENLKSKLLKEYDNLKNTKVYKDKLNEIKQNPEYKHIESLRQYVSLMFDTKWTDVFWNFWLETKKPKDKPCIDEMMLSYICNFCITNEIIRISDGDLSITRNSVEHEEIESLMKKKNNIPYELLLLILIIDKNNHELLNSVSDEERKKIYQVAENNQNYNSLLFELIDAFDNISIKNDKWMLKTYLSNDTYYSERDIFAKIVYDYKSSSRNYEEKAFFFIYYLYISKNKTCINDELFNAWLQFSYNVIKQSYQLTNGPFNYGTCILGLNYIYDVDINKKLIKVDLSKIVTLDKYQLEEEVLKAKLRKNSVWKDSLSQASKELSYFEGQLYYILIDFCKVTEANLGDKKLLEKFNRSVAIMHSIFPTEAGCKEEFENELITAVLSVGDYMKTKGRNWSLLKNDDRDISWYRMLKKQDDDDRCLLFNEILKDKKFDIDNPKDSLASFAANRLEEMDNDWRKAIVKSPKVLKILGPSNYLRWNWVNENHKQDVDENWEIDLLSGERINSKHAELFSYSLYFRIKSEDYSPFVMDYNYSSTESSQPEIRLKNFNLGKEYYYIFISYIDDGKFSLSFINIPDEDCEKIKNKSVLQILEDRKFDSEDSCIFTKIIKEDSVKTELLKLCKLLSEL